MACRTRQTDDLLLLLVETANQAVATPAGWAEVPSSPQGVGTAAGTAATRLSVFYRWVDGTETNASVADSGDHQVAQIICYRGVDPVNPFNASAGSINSTASTTVTFPSVTTTVDDCRVLLMEAHALPDANSTAIVSGHTNANLVNIIEQLDQNTNAGNGGGFSLADGTKVTAGATGTSSATLTTSSVGAHITLALAPLVLAEIVGDGAATEAGSDAATGDGGVLVRGAGAAAEAGNDTASATGAVSDPPVTGSGAALEAGSDAASGVGVVPVQGSGAATEAGTDVAASTGRVVVQGAGATAETGQDAAAATGGLTAVATGSGAAVESGEDAAAADGRVIVQGVGAPLESGADAAASAGGVLIAGAGAAQELGLDSANGSGTLSTVVSGTGEALESGQDAAAAAGSVLVAGVGAASEPVTDAAVASGRVLVQGQGAGTEPISDAALGDGNVVTVASGFGAITESGPDTVEGYVLPGYVEPGYVAGTSGTVGTVFTITGAQALLLRRLCQLHGLMEPLLVGPGERRAGDLVQRVTEAGDTVTIATIGGHDTFQGQPGQMIEELAALHGLTTELTVTASGRQAGAVVQVFTSEGATTTVTRQ